MDQEMDWQLTTPTVQGAATHQSDRNINFLPVCIIKTSIAAGLRAAWSTFLLLMKNSDQVM